MSNIEDDRSGDLKASSQAEGDIPFGTIPRPIRQITVEGLRELARQQKDLREVEKELRQKVPLKRRTRLLEKRGLFRRPWSYYIEIR